MDYEKKLKDALKDENTDYEVVRWIESNFPELGESEDEKIRKNIIRIFKGELSYTSKEDVDRYITWLEKQESSLVKNGYTNNKDFIRYADSYSHEIWHKLMDNFKNIKDYHIGCNDVSDIVLNAIIDTCNWLEKQGKQKATTVWHDVSEVPDEMQELLVEWESPDATWHNIAFYDAATKAFRYLKQPIDNVTRWAYVSDILTQSVTKTSDKEKGSEQIPANPEKNIKYEPKFKAGDKLISTKNPHLTYEIIDIEDNELGELDYNVIIYPDGKCAVYNKLSCKKVDSWGEFVEENPAWSEEDEKMLDFCIKHYADGNCTTWLESLKTRLKGK